jgi:hypothetical protein
MDDAATAARARRRDLLERRETQRWFHHVADADTGGVVTTSLDRPVAPVSRAERLSRLGHVFDPVFGAPMYRLSLRTLYQAAPEGWVGIAEPTYCAPAVDTVWWEPPRDFDVRTRFLGLYVELSQTPQGRALASFSLAGNSFAGATGHLLFQMQLIPNVVSIPVDAAFGHHTVDLTFVPPQRSIDITMALVAGIEHLEFHGLTFGTAPLVADPGVFA